MAEELVLISKRGIKNVFAQNGETTLKIPLVFEIVQSREREVWDLDPNRALDKILTEAISRLSDAAPVQDASNMSLRAAAFMLFRKSDFKPDPAGHQYPQFLHEMIRRANLSYLSVRDQGRVAEEIRLALAQSLLEIGDAQEDDAEITTAAVVIDSFHALEINGSREIPFPIFARSLITAAGLSETSSRIGPLSYRRGGPILGGAAPLYVAPRSQSLKVTLEPSGFRSAWLDLSVAERRVYDRLLKDHQTSEIGKSDESKVSVDAVRWPTLESLELGIECHIEPFSRARPFHRLLSEVPALYARLAPEAADFETDAGPHWPNILCMHSAILLEDPTGAPHILLSQRQKRGQRGSYSPGKWSASIEEQVVPGEILTADKPPRGLTEELMRDATAADAPSHFVAAILETEILNLALVQIVQLRRTFAEVVQSWPSAVDSTEHSQLIAVPLRIDVLAECIATGTLTPRAREFATASDPAIFARNTAWELHPTSAVRMALSLWQLS